MEWKSSACFFDCPDACGMSVQTDERGDFVRLKGNPKHGWSQGVLCAKTSWYGEVVQSEARILQPHIRNARGRFEVATWDQALDAIANQLGGLSPQEILSLEYAGNMGVLGRRFPGRVMHALGATRNDGTICDATAEAGYSAVLGRAIGFDLEQIEACDLIVLWGSDAARTMPHLLPKIKRAIRKGARVVAIDIYQTDTLEWVAAQGGKTLLVRPGTDAALALGLSEQAFESRRADLGFLREQCHGGAEFRAHLRGRYGAQAVCEVTGLSTAEFEEFADWIQGASAPLIKIGIGLCRRQVGGMTMRAITSYAAILGCADRVHWESGDHFDLDLSDLDGEHLRPQGCDQDQISLVGLGAELARGKIRASVVWGHNPAVTVPNSEAVRSGLARPDHFLVVHELFWTATAKLADVVLPATTFLDQVDLLRSYGHRWLHYVPAVLKPRGETRSNKDAFAALGQRMDLAPEVWDGSHEDWCERVLSQNRNRFDDQEWATLHAHEPVKLRPVDQAPTQAGPDWGTPSGRIELFSETLEAAGLGAMAEYTPDEGVGGDHEYWLWPSPSKATHNSTFLHTKRHQDRLGEPRVCMHPKTAQRLRVQDAHWVRLHNDCGSLSLRVETSERVPPGALTVTGFFHEAEIPERTNVNALVPSDVSDLGGGSSLYSTRVSVEVLPSPPELDSPS